MHPDRFRGSVLAKRKSRNLEYSEKLAEVLRSRNCGKTAPGLRKFRETEPVVRRQFKFHDYH